MDLYEAMSTLRAVRLRPDPIDEAIVERVLTAATGTNWRTRTLAHCCGHGARREAVPARSL